MYESIPPDSAIDPPVTSPPGVRCKRTSVSRLVVRRTPYACSPAVYGSVLIVAVRDCIVAPGSVSVPRPLSGVGALSVLCCWRGAEYPNNDIKQRCKYLKIDL